MIRGKGRFLFISINSTTIKYSEELPKDKRPNNYGWMVAATSSHISCKIDPKAIVKAFLGSRQKFKLISYSYF